MVAFFKNKKNIFVSLLLIVAVIISIFVPIGVNASPAMAGRHDVPILTVETNVKCVAITMNLEAYINMAKLREVLGNEKITFFASRYFEENYFMDLIRLKKDGHSIGILDKDSKGKTKFEVYDLLADRIENYSYLTGSGTELVRFKGYDSICVKSTLDVGLFPVQWSCDDTAEYFTNGNIILVYDIEGLIKMMKLLKNDGFTLVTVDELIYKENFSISLNGTQILNET
ncbi:MAG: hypothetical protein KBT46_05740 [Ruminococcus sp.]|nr:hypothetical protein [Candidatus Copronaster equi]